MKRKSLRIGFVTHTLLIALIEARPFIWCKPHSATHQWPPLVVTFMPDLQSPLASTLPSKRVVFSIAILTHFAASRAQQFRVHETNLLDSRG